MKALLNIDMQEGILQMPQVPSNLSSVVRRLNAVAAAVRDANGLVVFIQHHGHQGDIFAPGNSGWPLLDSLDRRDTDTIVSKTICDSFYETELQDVLDRDGLDELFIGGWATDYCVDTTVRAAASRRFNITVVADGHTAADRPHLNTAAIATHHHAVWRDLLVPARPIQVELADSIVRRLTK